MPVKQLLGKLGESFRGRRDAAFAYLWEKSHWRQQTVLKHQDFLQRVGLFLGNSGYVVGGAEYVATDMVTLRVCACLGAGMVMGYQFCQPRVQWLTAIWNVVYSVVNLYQLQVLLQDRFKEVPLTWEETELHRLFADNLTKVQLASLLQLGRFHWLVDGAKLTEQGQAGDHSQLFFITLGTCDVILEGQVVGTLGPGDVVGEASWLSESKHSSATVVANGSVRCFAMPPADLEIALNANVGLKAALEELFLTGLAAKVAALNEEVQALSYKAVLELSCSLHDFVEGCPTTVAEYRARHSIPDSLHQRLMLELSQCYRHAAEGGAFDLPNGKESQVQPLTGQAPVHPVAA